MMPAPASSYSTRGAGAFPGGRQRTCSASVRYIGLTAALVVGAAACARGGGGGLAGYRVALGDDGVASDIVLTRRDVPSDWAQVFDPPAESNMDLVTRRCFDAAGAPASGHFASANYIRDQSLIYSYVDIYPTEEAAAAAFRLIKQASVTTCMGDQPGSAFAYTEVQTLDGVGQQSIVVRFLFDHPTRGYFDIATVQEGRAVIFLLSRNRAGAFPVDLRDRAARAMAARAVQNAR